MVYVEQYGSFWSLTRHNWAQLVKLMVSGQDDYNLDHYGKRLKNRPKCIYQGEESCFSTSNEHPLHKPLDWDRSDWVQAAKLRD